ncbi:putative retrotransposon Ty1-copia subclass protein [Trifolium pratense]|uniref:Putative retrotransposon Ty1-copia subclass protein n=1 Tax=Trifolium pratense TaxID=57577 RepID=A0A2K3JV59_TRIPR|nr:putative retrotransposon Ty1-copia subclass protein [Trifolium pratense]
MVSGLPAIKVPEKVCKVCMMGNQTKNSFKSEVPSRASKQLEVVHSDVCGPFDTESLGGNRYFVSFVDEFNKMMWVYPMKTKDEVLIYKVSPPATATSEPIVAHDEAQVRRAERATKSRVWRKAMEYEIQSSERNNTWKLKSLLANKKPITVKWVYKVKHLPDGSIAKHKARDVARGQKSDIDFKEIFCRSGVAISAKAKCGSFVHSVKNFNWKA